VGGNPPGFARVGVVAGQLEGGAIETGLQQQFDLTQIAFDVKLPTGAERPLEHHADDRHDDREASHRDDQHGAAAAGRHAEFSATDGWLP
jgi:hypothetical protein